MLNFSFISHLIPWLESLQDLKDREDSKVNSDKLLDDSLMEIIGTTTARELAETASILFMLITNI
jgi:hypothetical protein